MENTLHNYEPNNELFRSIFLAALCIVFSFFYTAYRFRSHESFAWYDWLMVGALGLVAMYCLKKTQTSS